MEAQLPVTKTARKKIKLFCFLQQHTSHTQYRSLIMSSSKSSNQQANKRNVAGVEFNGMSLADIVKTYTWGNRVVIPWARTQQLSMQM